MQIKQKRAENRKSKPFKKGSSHNNNNKQQSHGPIGGLSVKSAIAPVSDKLVVSNLAFSVTQNDVKELFGRIGKQKKQQ